MTITEVIPIITSLSHTDKFQLMQIILAQLAKEEEVPLQGATTNCTCGESPTPPTMKVEKRDFHGKRQDPLFDIIGMAEGEDTDVARRHNDYLYGAS